MNSPNRLARNNILLLICILAIILFYPQFENESSLVRDLLLTGVFFSGIYSLDFSPRSKMVLLPLATLTAITTWLHHFVAGDMMSLVDFGTSTVTLAVIVVLMVRHIARSREVTPTIILNAVNGYLLLGVLGAILFNIANGTDIFLHGAGGAGILLPGKGIPEFSDYLYMAFITLTTVGYGDMVPSSHLTRSVAMFIGLSGQLYMTILIAMLVGKFLAGNDRQ